MAHANITPEEVLRKILNEVSDKENDDIEETGAMLQWLERSHCSR